MKIALNESFAAPGIGATGLNFPDGGLAATESETERRRCFHCGEFCAQADFEQEGSFFCCQGCLIVHDLLRQSGLEHFYDLSRTPGVRIKREARRSQYAYLDEPSIQERLLDFTDGKTSRVTFRVPAIHCVACIWLLENLFKLHRGIGRSEVNFSRREVGITFDANAIQFSEVAALLASIGYEPELTLAETGKKKPLSIRKKAWLQIGLAAFAFGNIMLMSLPFYFGLDSLSGPWFKEVAGWLNLAMALPVVTFSAWDFWKAAWLSLRQRTLTLEVPIALGLGAIYARSVFDVFFHRGPGFCDSLCGLVFFLLCGRLFQKKTYDRLTFDRDYQGFFPLAIVRKTAKGEESAAIPDLKTGDHLILRHGELLPADARLISGQACMDYSFVTGESEPSVHAPGDHLFAGGRQTGGWMEVQTLKPVAESYLASLWNNEAFRKKRDDDLDVVTNRYSRWFTRLVVGIALAAAVFWIFVNAGKTLKAFTSVLIVACPCALALASPLTQGTAQRLLARRKIFLKNAGVVEAMGRIDTIVLDKTGTLTTPNVPAVKFHSWQDLSEEEKVLAASLADHSTHPHSQRIARWLGGIHSAVKDFNETAGYGIEGMVDGRKILLGSCAWLEDFHFIPAIKDCTRPGAGSAVYLAIGGTYRGVFALENPLRPEIEKFIRCAGGRFELALLSGDNEREAVRFRLLFGEAGTLKFNQSPADKLSFVKELQERGRRVMMVGDGLNDAGALKQADVGVAVVERVGVFSPASDVIIDAAELPQLVQVLDFCKKASRVVRLGFAISALYNLAGISIAAAGLLEPVVCAIIMPVSTATIVIFSCMATTWAARRTGLLATFAPTGGRL